MARYISVLNWEKYQARLDKDLPWLKLWSSFFDREWWQALKDEFKIIPIICLDVAKKFNNKMPKTPDYYIRNYGLNITQEDLIFVSNILKTNGFLSDCLVGLLSQTDESDVRASSLILSKDLKEGCGKPIDQSVDETMGYDAEFNQLEAFHKIWDEYPQKGKVRLSASMHEFFAVIGNAAWLERIETALKKYKNYLKNAGWDMQPMNFLKWFAEWPEWEIHEEPKAQQKVKSAKPDCDVCAGSGFLPDKPQAHCFCWDYHPQLTPIRFKIAEPEIKTETG